MISQAVEYSLRAMVLLARNASGPMTIQSLAEHGGISAPYLAKLLQGLTKSGLVKSQRGLRGGFQLARPADQISIADVVNSVEPMQRILKCPLGITDHEHLCPLHHKLDQAMALVERSFCETKLSDLCQGAADVSPLCKSQPPVVSLSTKLRSVPRENG